MTETKSTSVNAEQVAIIHRPLPTGLTVGIVALIAGGGWLLGDFWMQSRRFPVPRHMAERTSEWVLPILGRVSPGELILLILDGIVLLPAICWLLWRRKRRS